MIHNELKRTISTNSELGLLHLQIHIRRDTKDQRERVSNVVNNIKKKKKRVSGD